VVGVVGDVKNAGIDKPTGTEIFLPYLQSVGGGLRTASIIIKGTQNPSRLMPAVRSEINAVDPSLPIASIRTMDEVLQSARSRPRFLRCC